MNTIKNFDTIVKRKNLTMDELSLAPSHQADLEKSGLSPNTVRLAGIHSVRPSDINRILGPSLSSKVSSLLAFPYPGDGFVRYKLFPTVHDKDDHSMRYYQPKGSGVHLYFPPDIEKVLSNPDIPIAIVEGEKKSLKATQEGIPCIALGGVWSWCKPGTYDLIDDFNGVVLQGREVNIVFDSPDILTNSNVRLAAYRLAKALMKRGAIPHLVITPPRKKKTEGGEIEWEKVGLDDFLIEHSAEEFLKLKRILLTEEMIEKELISQLIHRDLKYTHVSTTKSSSSRCKKHTIKVFDFEGDSTKTLNFSAPCRAWDCPDCYPYLLNHWLEIILYNFPMSRAYYSMVNDREWGAWKKRVNGESWFRVFSGTAGNYLVLSTTPIKDFIPVSGQQFEDLLKKYLKREPAPLNGRRKVTHSQNIELPSHLKNPDFEEGSGKKKRIAVLIPMHLKEVIEKEMQMGAKIVDSSKGMIIMESPKVLLDRYRAMAKGKIVPIYSMVDPLQNAVILGRV